MSPAWPCRQTGMAEHQLHEPTAAVPIAGDATPPTTPMPWPEARRRLAEAPVYWLATTGPGGRPHVRPVLAVWVDDTLYTTSRPGASKARNLAANDRCSFSVSADAVDVVLEGTASKVSDEARLQRVADAYASKYEWPATVADGAFDAPYGAPTAGPPPYQVYVITPTAAYGFGTDEEHAPRSTRWEFAPS
jgi:nitroimidazol reductase NimA-like FMN-containing flavoprotein (pyridoxamine 5'-phosphate oxidase superfamily)